MAEQQQQPNKSEVADLQLNYERKLNSEEFYNIKICDEIEGWFFTRGFRNICWLCNPPVGFKTISQLEQHNDSHRTWHH